MRSRRGRRSSEEVNPLFGACIIERKTELTSNVLPTAFSRLVLNFHISVLLGSGCSHSFLGTGCPSAMIAACSFSALPDVLPSYRDPSWVGMLLRSRVVCWPFPLFLSCLIPHLD